MRRIAALLPALLLVLSAGTATPQTGLGGDAPLEIYAESGIEWHREQRVYIARGNARAISGDTELRANELRAYYSGANDGTGEIQRIEAVGAVVITSPNGKVYGDRGVYDVPGKVMVLTGGNLKLVTEQDTVTARDSLEYWEAKDLAVARGDAEAQRVDPEDGSLNVIRAEVMTASFYDNAGKKDLRVVDAYEAVEILTPCEYAVGDRARYLVPEQVAILTGNVKITRGSNQLNGDEAEVNLKTGISTLKGDRVSGLLVPKGGGDAPANPECES